MTIPDYFRADTFDTSPTAWDDKGLRSHQRIAARFAQFAQGQVLHVAGAGWHAWDGMRWKPERDGHTARNLLRKLLAISWSEAMADKDLAADVKSSMTANGSNGVLDLAAHHPELYAYEVDADPWLLNLQNGTLDLHTQTLKPHDPEDRITKICNAAYNPDTMQGVERWLGFLDSSLPDRSIQGFLQRFIGSTLIGQVIDHVLVIATGSGRNGKSVLANAVTNMLGDYATTATNDLLTTGKKGHKSAGELSAQMMLRGARWAVMSELDKGEKLAESTMKTLTGGDMITAKHMGRDWVEFKPSHSFFMLTNDLPTVDPTAKAVWARMRVVPFDVSFEGREDTALERDLELASDAILAWAIAGLAAYQESGLAAPESVMARTQSYRNENDSVAQFIDEECVLNYAATISRQALHIAYINWATINGGEQLSPKAFTPRIVTLPGVTDARNSKGRYWKGLGLKNDES